MNQMASWRPLNLFDNDLHRAVSSFEEDPALKSHVAYDLNLAEVVERLRLIYSPEQLIIDLDEALAIKRPGFDLSAFQAESFRCHATEVVISHVNLVLKRLTCIDRRMYDIKVYEMDTFMRFLNHPSVVSLYAMWNEPVSGPYAFKTLVGLYREGVRGDLYEYAVDRPDGRRLRALRVKLLGCNIASALRSFHNCNIIHASIRPRNIYVDEARVALVGEFGKVELDSLRYSHHMFSKLFIANAIHHKLAYWAPELITMQQYGKEIDCWALGVTIYQMMIGQLPWPTDSEDSFRQAVIAGAKGLDMKILDQSGIDPVLRETVLNLLHPNPLHRWTADQTLAYLQFDFAVEVQRLWRGTCARRRHIQVCSAARKLQAAVRGMLARRELRPMSHYAESARSIAGALSTETEAQRHVASPNDDADMGQEARVQALQAYADDVILDGDLHGRESGRVSRGKGNAGTGEYSEVARLQGLLQARDVQLNILMKMLAEADATSVGQRQRIAVLQGLEKDNNG
jgi:hypothetical protein